MHEIKSDTATGNKVAKTINVNRLLTGFLMAFILFFGGSTLVLTSLQVKNTLHRLQQESLETEGKSLATTLRRNLRDRVMILSDHAQLPLIVSSVMNPSQNLVRVKDHLARFSLLGNTPGIALLDFDGLSIAAGKTGLPEDYRFAPWLTDILEGRKKQHIGIGLTAGGKYFWELAVGVDYHNITEGALVAAIPAEDTENLLQWNHHGLRAFSILSGKKEVLRYGPALLRPGLTTIDMADVGIILQYEMDGAEAARLQRVLILQILGFAGLTALLSVPVFIWIGRKIFVIPQTELHALTSQLQVSLARAKEERSRSNTILQSIGDGLIVSDHHNRIVLLNPAAEAMFGLKLEQVAGDLLIDLVNKDRFKKGVDAAFGAENYRSSFEFALPAPASHANRVMRVRTSGVLLGTGRHSGIISIISDVSHEYEINRMKTEFISTAAHELKTPLTTLLGFSEVLLERDALTRDDQKRYLGYINQQAHRLTLIVNNILDMSEIDSGRGFRLDKKAHILGAVIKAVVLEYQNSHPNHTFVLDLSDGHIEVACDKDRMIQVLGNLFSNAAKFSPDSGVITINGKAFDGYYHIIVRDNGIGIPPAELGRIFDKFYRVDASNVAPEGTGLGLTMVRHITEAHGGKVWAESEFKQGTQITLKIPISSRDD